MYNVIIATCNVKSIIRTSISDTGYVHFNVNRSFPEKSSVDLGVTETHTTKSFSNNNLLLLDFVIMPF